jgi:hypothetical protein
MFVDVLGEAVLAGQSVQGTFWPPADQVLMGHCIIMSEQKKASVCDDPHIQQHRQSTGRH